MNAARSHSDQPVRATSPIILAVEDDVLVRAVAAAHLRECGFEVIEAGDAHEAVRVLAAAVPVDLVFSDVQMPGSMDGIDLAHWVRRERPELKIILTSGTAPRIADAADLGEPPPFLAKPYDHAELERRIRSLLAP